MMSGELVDADCDAVLHFVGADAPPSLAQTTLSLYASGGSLFRRELSTVYAQLRPLTYDTVRHHPARCAQHVLSGGAVMEPCSHQGIHVSTE